MTAPRLRGAFVWVFGALIIIASMGFHQAAHAQASHEPRASISDLQKQFSLSGTWRFKAGDNPAWAAPDFDDSLWDSKPIPGRWPAGGYPESGQVGWYRLTVKLLADGGFGPLDDSHLAERQDSDTYCLKVTWFGFESIEGSWQPLDDLYRADRVIVVRYVDSLQNDADGSSMAYREMKAILNLIP